MIGSRYIRKLTENEARFVVLRILLKAKKGQSTASELKDRILDFRDMGQDDLKPSDTRSGEPMFRQIVQNATDRMDKNIGLYRRTYIDIVSPAPERVIRLTDEGYLFTRQYQNYVDLLKSKGFEEFHFFDESAITCYWARISSLFGGVHLNIPKTTFINCVRSEKFALSWRSEIEGKGLFVKWANELCSASETDISLGKLDISKCRPNAVRAWLQTRNEIHEYLKFFSPSLARLT